ncbi:MAG: phage portal protein [Gammaproteobacteria bacterium]|nr:phage portal protein [Gammaproteobacteria bacterium]
MLQSRQFQLGEIARIFRVPSHLINDTPKKSTSWGSGIEQLNLGFLQYTLRPYLTRWESVLRDSLLSSTDREVVVIEHNVEGLLRADSAARANFYAQMAQNGLMSRNEIRRKENLRLWSVVMI